MGVVALYFGFATPKRHFLARNRVVWRILRQNRCTRLGCCLSQETKKVAESLCAEGREITHVQNRNPSADLDKILHGCRYPRRSYLHKFWWPSVKGFLSTGVKFSPLPLTFIVALTTLLHYRASVWYHFHFVDSNHASNNSLIPFSSWRVCLFWSPRRRQPPWCIGPLKDVCFNFPHLEVLGMSIPSCMPLKHLYKQHY